MRQVPQGVGTTKMKEKKQEDLQERSGTNQSDAMVKVVMIRELIATDKTEKVPVMSSRCKTHNGVV